MFSSRKIRLNSRATYIFCHTGKKNAFLWRLHEVGAKYKKILVASIFGVYRQFLSQTLYWWGFLMHSCHMTSKDSGVYFLLQSLHIFYVMLKVNVLAKTFHHKCHTDNISLSVMQHNCTVFVCSLS